MNDAASPSIPAQWQGANEREKSAVGQRGSGVVRQWGSGALEQ